ncbi:MAG TPA: aminopeptidase N [Geminicoccus sp.]|jgi:aminopeptidase N|uniref:aminopeptidase N n=1 Tax=Geminicoccus sp. TaxID=2024832 RepID=UPI002E362ED6|nr:aminopeptidase N [Geminicoccus sp.]HEX2529504.1 aminopeptidase N [Geminicoccus sp.]
MADGSTRTIIRREDYREPDWWTRQIELDVDLQPEDATIVSRLTLEKNDKAEGKPDLELDGEALTFVSARVNGVPLPADRIQRTSTGLRIAGLPDQCVLEIIQRCNPKANTALTGLYLSNGIFCTQCEAQGFRRIAFSQDRPDVMSTYRVRVTGDRKSCPVLLSNGNPLASGDLPDGRHWALWEDPFPKPSYLFALVAGDLALLQDSFTTMSGRTVDLRIYSEHAVIDQCHHAMASLKKSMKWDEEAYGLEYDLDLFMIVAVSHFNMGAMENKGLNIFNTSATLARADTATDADFMQVERIVAHEYFHNWTGNRVTCRDWFQLTLKEGLTVFRDQQFSADMHSAPVKRIGDVQLLREGQFPEDAGPMSHPIRPDSYVEINNFYTRTVYEKGAEVIRMIHTLIGSEKYRAGIDLYFQRHDGQAVTCEDFVKAMEGASGKDLTQFRRWYSQAGTPKLDVQRSFDPSTGTYVLDITQTTPPTAGQPDKQPLHIPLRLGLIGRDGTAQPLMLEGENEPKGTERVLELTEPSQRFVFKGLQEEPIPSLLRNFSAPVRLNLDYADDELATLLGRDEDAFNRWEAGQQLALRLILRGVDAGGHAEASPSLLDAFRNVLNDAADDPAFAARAVQLPSFAYVGQQRPMVDVEGITGALKSLQRSLSTSLRAEWAAAYDRFHNVGPFTADTASVGRRAMKNQALYWAVQSPDAAAIERAKRQFERADNMTDSFAALRALVESRDPAGDTALGRFYARWQGEPLVVNKWFALQASIDDDRALPTVERLMHHPAFTMGNPNRVFSLVGVFANGNPVGFHRKDGAGYRFVMDRILELDPRNPQVASRLLRPLGRFKQYDQHRQQLMRAEIERALAQPNLSRDCYEIASKSLE